MSQQSSTAITTQAQASVRQNAATIAGGITGASVVALLAVASTLPLLAGGMAPAAVAAWLAGLGSNALANWLTQWAERNLARYEGDDPDWERRLLEQLARDLTAQFSQSHQIASDVEIVLLQTDAFRVAIEALSGQSDKQVRMLQLLSQDMQSARVENSQLHQAAYTAVQQQAQQILDAQTQATPPWLPSCASSSRPCIARKPPRARRPRVPRASPSGGALGRSRRLTSVVAS